MIKFQINGFIVSIINLLYIPFKKFIPPETFRYAVTGGFNLILDIFLYFIFYNFILQKQIVDFGIFAIVGQINKYSTNNFNEK